MPIQGIRIISVYSLSCNQPRGCHIYEAVFRRLQRTALRPTCKHETNVEALDIFSWNLILGNFMTYCLATRTQITTEEAESLSNFNSYISHKSFPFNAMYDGAEWATCLMLILRLYSLRILIRTLVILTDDFLSSCSVPSQIFQDYATTASSKSFSIHHSSHLSNLYEPRCWYRCKIKYIIH